MTELEMMGKRAKTASAVLAAAPEEKKNRERFEKEMEPNISALRTGVVDISQNVEKELMRDDRTKTVET